jgi:signal transduction histidine kinase
MGDRMTNPTKILLVDDLDENLLALEAILRRHGLECVKALSGEEALELLLMSEFALALLDVQMPGMDGFQLAEFMRGSERSRHIPIIFLTAGTADVQRRFRGYEAGAVDFIQKPIEPDIIRSKTRVFCDLYEQRRQIALQRDELEAYATNLSTANRHKNQFLAILGHELRNPIMALDAGLALLKRRGDDAEKAQGIRIQMESQIAHLSRLVEDLLDISRIDQGKISLKKERVELGAVLAAAIELSRPLIDNEHHTLSLNLAPQPVWLNGDFTRLSQVVSNLLNNAAKYTPHGGKIGLTARIDSAYVEIEVSDNGIGISPDMQSKIFDIFTQVSSASKNAKEGLGIGLALVKQLVEMHGGTISLESEGLNTGSVFKVRLPISE